MNGTAKGIGDWVGDAISAWERPGLSKQIMKGRWFLRWEMVVLTSAAFALLVLSLACAAGDYPHGSGDESPAWSPNGKLIVYSHWKDSGGTLTNAIWVSDPGGTHARKLWDDGLSPGWSPDGSEIVFESGNGLWVMRPDGSHAQSVANTSNADDPDWSPDGKWIAFSLTNGRRGIFVIRLDGTGRRRLTTGADSEPDWSPDGRRIVFAHIPQRGGGEVTVISADGSKRRIVAVGSSPAWSPDGTQIVYAGTPDSPKLWEAQLFIVPTNRQSVKPRRQLTAFPDYADEPSWRPDGKNIALSVGAGIALISLPVPSPLHNPLFLPTPDANA